VSRAQGNTATTSIPHGLSLPTLPRNDYKSLIFPLPPSLGFGSTRAILSQPYAKLIVTDTEIRMGAPEDRACHPKTRFGHLKSLQ